jgi:hypothetical protein
VSPRDPLEEDEWPREQRKDEELREDRWEAFKAIARNFAETEGWSGVLNAVAQAMRDDTRGES